MNYNVSVDGYKGFRYLNNIEDARAKATERLSSGYRINHTSDDAAGASMSATLRTQIRGLMQARQNSEDMINLLNTAETGIGTMTEMMQRIRELAVQAASDTNTAEERMYMQQEVDQLLEEIERVSKGTEFNGITLFNNDPDVTRRLGGLRVVLGGDHITPDGNFSEIYSTWDMLDKTTGGANATPNTYKTKVTSYIQFASYESEYTYSNFRANGSNYIGSLYDSSGSYIGEVNADGTLTLNTAGEALLPAKESNKSGYQSSPTTSDSYNYKPAGTETVISLSGQTTVSVDHSVSASSGAVYGMDASGTSISLSYNFTEKITGSDVERHESYADYEGNHIAVTIDFEKFNQAGGYKKASLYDTGFNSTCATCPKHFSIKFVEGTTNEVIADGVHYKLYIGIDVLDDKSTGEDLAKLVVDSVTACADEAPGSPSYKFATHYIQYAYSGATLYIFDPRNGRPGSMDSFAAGVYNEPIKEISREPLVYAQVGSNADDRVAIALPYISLKTLKIEDVDVTIRENATDTIEKMDEAMAYLTKERAKISLWAARISHSASNADIGAYNNTLSDSKVMDTNYADEVLKLSKAQVLTEFGVSSITEVQKMIENVLRFIG